MFEAMFETSFASLDFVYDVESHFIADIWFDPLVSCIESTGGNLSPNPSTRPTRPEINGLGYNILANGSIWAEPKLIYYFI